MVTTTEKTLTPTEPPVPRESHATRFGRGFFVKLFLMMLVDALGLYIALSAWQVQQMGILAVDVALLIVVNWVYFSRRALAAKYLVPGLVFLLIYQVFTMGYTAYIAFTNYGFGHNSSKSDAVASLLMQNEKRVEGSASYPATVLEADDGHLGLAVVVDGAADVGDAETPLAADDGATVSDGRVTAVPGWQVLSYTDMLARQKEVTDLRVPFSGDAADGSLRTTDGSNAYLFKSTLVYDEAADTLTDTATGTVYTADDKVGSFVGPDGQAIAPGWRVVVGLKNFTDMFTGAASGISQSLWKVAIWTFVFAFATVALNFLLGLFLAMVMNSPRVRGRKVLRSLLILPYAFPAFLTFLLWRGMLNIDFGFVNQILLGGAHVAWLTDPWLAKFSVLFVNLWAGYPYMFLVTTGALQAIPTDCLESAQIDGAGGWRVFRSITLPMVFISTAPLLISAFAFNFNNFNIIYLLTAGGPSYDATAAVNLGATDILISAVYKVSGVDGRSGDANYGLASAMSIVIFIVVGLVAYLSFRQTRKSEDLI